MQTSRKFDRAASSEIKILCAPKLIFLSKISTYEKNSTHRKAFSFSFKNDKWFRSYNIRNTHKTHFTYFCIFETKRERVLYAHYHFNKSYFSPIPVKLNINKFPRNTPVL